MALAKLFMESFGLLEGSVVVPLDAHPELARKATPGIQEFRSDLLVVSADPATCHLNFLVVEAKCLSGVGLSADLRSRIDAQTASSATGLREAFEIAEVDDRIDRQVQSWRLTTLLSFYLQRAVRYGLISPSAAHSLGEFFLTLDSGYGSLYRRMGLVFRHESASSYCDRADPELPIWVIGRDLIDEILAEGLSSFTTPPGDQASEEDGHGGPPPAAPRRLRRHPTWPEVQTDFGAAVHLEPVRGADAPPKLQVSAITPTDSAPIDDSSDQSPDVAAVVPKPPPSVLADSEDVTGWRELDLPRFAERDPSAQAGPPVQVMLGETEITPQYGLLGTVSADPSRRVGLDLNGCNTISIFGVQGSGKSYTVGSIVEMAVKRLPAINLLPGPLGAVVFHYHQTQDYPPEFVSMIAPNNDNDEVQVLRALGAEPNAVDDLLILTTADTVALRQTEFPDVDVRAIQFSSSELTVADWRFLMGAVGNDSLYLKVINRVMQAARYDLTLEGIRRGIESSQLTDTQRTLAMSRLDLASRFIDDSSSLRSSLRPGRVVVVDLRDEFIEREEALGLFVTMLNVFSGAGLANGGAEAFNKLVVFDEAHKYMTGSLMTSVVEVIREMRHKGVSVVVASQDPVNVPSSVVELSSVVCLHRFNSPGWLKHIQRSLAALGNLTPAMLASLRTGEAFVWANRSSDVAFTRHATKVHMRPRVTRHGGGTRRVIGS